MDRWIRIRTFVLWSWVAVVAFSCMLLALGRLGSMLVVKDVDEDGKKGGMGEASEMHQVRRHDLAHEAGPDIADGTAETAGNRFGGGEVNTVATNRFMRQKETTVGGSAFSEGERVFSATSAQAGAQVERRQHGNEVRRVEKSSALDAAQNGEPRMAPQSAHTDARTTGQVVRSESILPEASDRGVSQQVGSPPGQRPGEAKGTEWRGE